MKWLLVIFSILGDYLLVKKHWLGFVGWIICDVYFCYYNFSQGEYPEASLFLIYMIFAVYGIYEWRKSDKGFL